MTDKETVAATEVKKPEVERAPLLPRLYRSAGAGVVGMVAILSVGGLEAMLQPHRDHVRSRASLRQVNDALQVSIDRRQDLAQDLRVTAPSPTRPTGVPPVAPGAAAGVASFPYAFNDIERAGYRRAAVAELYQIHLSVTSLLRTGNQLIAENGDAVGAAVQDYSQLCKDWDSERIWARTVNCPAIPSVGQSSVLRNAWSRVLRGIERVHDSAVTPGTYAQSIYHLSSLLLILIGFLSFIVALLSLTGTLLGITVDGMRDFLMKLFPGSVASIGTIAAGLVGAGAIAGGFGAAAVSSSGLSGAMVDERSAIHIEATNGPLTQSEPNGGGRESLLDARRPLGRGDVTIGPTNTLGLFFPGGDDVTSGETALALREVARALEALAHLPPVGTGSQPDPSRDAGLVQAVSAAGNAVAVAVTQSAKSGSVEVEKLTQNVADTKDLLNSILREQVRTTRAVESGTATASAAFDKVVDETAKVHAVANTLVPIAETTSCQVKWQKALNARNGLQRTWDVISGHNSDPCGS